MNSRLEDIVAERCAEIMEQTFSAICPCVVHCAPKYSESLPNFHHCKTSVLRSAVDLKFCNFNIIVSVILMF